MGHGGYTLELSLKDSVSAGLKDMGRALSNVRELVGSLRADVSALNKESGQAVSGLDLGKLAEGAADQLEGLSKGALQELDAAFRDSGKTMADYYAERRRQAGETADMERENASEQAERMAQELEARKDAYQAELEAFVAHGQNWAEAQQAQADREVSIKAEQAEREKAIDAQRLEGALSLAGGMADAMKQVYESGLAQSKGVYQLYQALAIAEATISTYKAAQAAYAQGMEWGGPVVGAIMAATAVAAGMARVAAIKSTPLKGFAFGGLIGGQDKGERADNVLIRATPGEYMLDRPTVRHYGVSALEALRRRSVPRELLEPFASPRLPASGGKRTAYALGGEIGNGSLTEGGKASGNEGLTVINVMDFQREFDRALASTRGRRVLINILGEEGTPCAGRAPEEESNGIQRQDNGGQPCRPFGQSDELHHGRSGHAGPRLDGGASGFADVGPGDGLPQYRAVRFGRGIRGALRRHVYRRREGRACLQGLQGLRQRAGRNGVSGYGLRQRDGAERDPCLPALLECRHERLDLEQQGARRDRG